MPRAADLIVDALAQTEGRASAPAEPFGDLIRSKASKYGLDPHLLGAVVHVESSGKPNAVSPKGAVGLGQIMPGTARDLGVKNPRDPAQNLEGAARLLRQHLDTYGGDERLALAAYNAGPGAVRGGHVPPAAAPYVEKVQTAAALRRRANVLSGDLASRGGGGTGAGPDGADSLVEALARYEGNAPASPKPLPAGAVSSSPEADSLVGALATTERHPPLPSAGGAYVAPNGARLAHPDTAGAFRQLVDAARAEGIEVRLNSGDRDHAKQQAIWDGASPIPGNPNLRRQRDGLPVARPGTSPHERGTAADLSFFRGGQRLDPRLVIPLARQHGFEWLGPSDPVHFDFRPHPATLAELRRRDEAALSPSPIRNPQSAAPQPLSAQPSGALRPSASASMTALQRASFPQQFGTRADEPGALGPHGAAQPVPLPAPGAASGNRGDEVAAQNAAAAWDRVAGPRTFDPALRRRTQPRSLLERAGRIAQTLPALGMDQEAADKIQHDFRALQMQGRAPLGPQLAADPQLADAQAEHINAGIRKAGQFINDAPALVNFSAEMQKLAGIQPQTPQQNAQLQQQKQRLVKSYLDTLDPQRVLADLKAHNVSLTPSQRQGLLQDLAWQRYSFVRAPEVARAFGAGAGLNLALAYATAPFAKLAQAGLRAAGPAVVRGIERVAGPEAAAAVGRVAGSAPGKLVGRALVEGQHAAAFGAAQVPVQQALTNPQDRLQDVPGQIAQGYAGGLVLGGGFHLGSEALNALGRRLLGFLSPDRPALTADLARQAGTTPQQAVQVLGALEQQGHVQRTPQGWRAAQARIVARTAARGPLPSPGDVVHLQAAPGAEPATPNPAPAAPPAGPPRPAPSAPPAPPAPTPTVNAAPESPVPGRVVELPISEIRADPQRFQYKVGTNTQGVTPELRGVQKWNRNLAGVVLVWRDPENGLTYIVNGHHRLDLANRLGQPTIDARYIDAANASEARFIGAAANVAEGRGTAIDAAKLFRERRLSPQQIQEQGISLRGKTAADGLALANLSEPLWQRVFRGEMPVSRGVAIGAGLTDPAEQHALVSLLDSAEKRGKRLTDNEITELVRQVTSAPTATSTQGGLFGEEEVRQNLAVEKAQLGAWLKETLGRDKRTFGFVSKEQRAAELTRGGNVINTEESGRIAGEAGQALEVFDRLSTRSGPVADALNDAARRMAAGEKLDAVRTELYGRVREAVRGELAGRQPAGALGAEEPVGRGDSPAGGGRPGAGPEPLGPVGSRRAAGSPGGGAAEPITSPAPASLADLAQEANGSLREDVLNHLRTGRTLPELVQRLQAQGHDPQGAARVLAELQREGKIVVEGSGRSAVYRAGAVPRSSGPGESLFLSGEREAAGAQAQQGLDLGAEPVPPSRSQQALSALDAAEQAALERFNSRRGRLQSGIDPEDLGDLVIIGAARIGKGLVRFGEWSAGMVRDFGEEIRPHLQDLWQRARAHYEEHFRAGLPDLPAIEEPRRAVEPQKSTGTAARSSAQPERQEPAAPQHALQASPERGGQPPTEEPVHHSALQPREDGRFDGPPEYPASDPRATGLAEQTNRREVESGRLAAMPEKGRSVSLPEVTAHGERVLREINDRGGDPVARAEEVAASAAREGRPFTREETGVVLAGKRRLLNARDAIGEKLDGLPRNSPERPRLLAEYEAAKERLQAFADNAQKGVSEAGGVLSSLRAGTQLDTGDYASALREVERVTGKTSQDLTDVQKRTLKDLTEQVAAQDAKIREQERKVRELEASAAVEQEARRAPRPSKRQSIREERQAIFAEIDAIVREAGGKTHSLGSAAYDSVRFGYAAGKLALSYAREGVATLEEVVQRVVEDFHARGVTVDRDQVVDDLAEVTKGAPHNPTAAQRALAELKRQARREVELRGQIVNLRAGIPNAPAASRPAMTARAAELVRERDTLLGTVEGRDLAEQQRVRRRIEVLKSGQPTPPREAGPAPSPELAALRGERDALNKARLKQAAAAARDQGTQPGRVINQRQKTLDRLKGRIAELEAGAPSRQTLYKTKDAEIDALRKRQAELERQAANQGVEPGRTINARIKSQDRARVRLDEQIADLEEQLRTGNLRAASPQARQVDAQLEKLRDRRSVLSRQVEARIQQLRPWSFGDVLQKIVVESGLSNPKLPAVKSVGNAVSAALQFPERLARAAADVPLSALQARRREVYAAEAARGAAAYFSALPAAARDLLNVLRTGTSGFERPGSAEFELPRREAPGGYVTNFATRNVAAVRAFFLRPAVEGELAAQATRQALKEGLQGPEFRARFEELVAKPTPEMLRNVERQSQFATFHGDLLKGEKGGPAEQVIRGLETAANAEGPLGVKPLRVVAPFLRTTFQIMHAGTKYSPLGLLDLAAKDSGGKVIAGTPQAATVIGRAAVGTALMAALAPYAASGRLTGAPPKDPAERKRWAQDNIQPYSVLVGDRWISYAHTGLPVVPLAQLTAMVDAYNRTARAPAPEKIAALGYGFAAGTLHGVAHAGVFNAAARLLDAIEDPSKLPEFLKGELASKVPLSGGLRAVAQMTDPYVRKPGNLGEAVKANVPGLSQQVPPRTVGQGKSAVPLQRATGAAALSPLEVSLPSGPAPNPQEVQGPRNRMDVFGRPVTPDAFGRVPPGSFAGSNPNDPVVRELTRLRVQPGFVAESVKVHREQVGLTRAQRDEYQRTAGREMYERLEKMISSPYYRTQTDAAREKHLRAAIARAREHARHQVIRELRQAQPR